MRHNKMKIKRAYLYSAGEAHELLKSLDRIKALASESASHELIKNINAFHKFIHNRIQITQDEKEKSGY